MEKHNWKIGKHKSTVVSDTKIKNTNFPSPPNPKESRFEEINYYGGYLICESIGNDECAKLIAAAPDLLEACNKLIEQISFKTGGEYVNEDGMPINSNIAVDMIQKAIKKATE